MAFVLGDIGARLLLFVDGVVHGGTERGVDAVHLLGQQVGDGCHDGAVPVSGIMPWVAQSVKRDKQAP